MGTAHQQHKQGSPGQSRPQHETWRSGRGEAQLRAQGSFLWEQHLGPHRDSEGVGMEPGALRQGQEPEQRGGGIQWRLLPQSRGHRRGPLSQPNSELRNSCPLVRKGVSPGGGALSQITVASDPEVGPCGSAL